MPDCRNEAGTSEEPLLGVAFDLTRQQEASQDLAEVIFGAGLGTWRLNVATRKNQINDRYAEMLGYSREELEPVTEESFLTLVHPEDAVKLYENRVARSKAGDYVFSDEIRMRHKDGHWVWVLSRCRPVDFASDGTPSVLSGVHIDISDRKALAEKLRLESDFLKRLVETSVSGIVAFNDKGRIYFVNKEATAILGLTSEQLIGLPLVNDYWTLTELDGTPMVPEDFPGFRVIATQTTVRDRRVSIRRHDGKTLSISITAAPMRMSDGGLQVVATLTDITAQLANEALLHNAAAEAMHAALHDPVSGLPNRELFEDSLAAAIVKAQRDRGYLLHVFLDIDNFKQVNDRFGHHAGDLLIRKVAARLERIRQGPQVLARVAGDEFTFLHPYAPGEDTREVLTRLASVFELPFDLGGYVVHISVSMGVSVYPEDATSSEELWLSADLAMYEAKARGRNQTVRFTAPLREREAEEARIAQILQRALKARAFEIFLMPLVDLRQGGRVVGAEALLRSTEPDLQGIGPAVFLPVAERTGLMRALDLMVVDMVGAATARLRAAGYALRISVNLSPDSLHETGFGLELLSHLDQAQLGARDVRFELTEGALVDLSSPAREVIDLLHDRGFELSADDFGTGYSSLSYLHKLRLSELKIDRSFVQRLETAEEPSDEIVRAILAMGQALGLCVVAEGIETEAQHDWLRRHGCPLGQGYLFGKGVDLDTFLQQHLTPKVLQGS
ncbi:putative bifunctional diguanylate cyclase/phosphodiesterase [Rhodovulum steppense]|uniref:PAS domain S-box-containing protein/diguanylate cyclase (GGDEF)-like protein n=1 Tax=Rhodovulum steppense TaxID=540251 RepID=A0A4R1YWC1_9RHOB|nr:EAL domain-containing protein [Rhodovulum steppense]TCM85448.1 PAS domain S-box-containing protein/diguanylate cyclase (GGDEF)-like protein [Rhodovulum steppense]